MAEVVTTIALVAGGLLLLFGCLAFSSQGKRPLAPPEPPAWRVDREGNCYRPEKRVVLKAKGRP